MNDNDEENEREARKFAVKLEIMNKNNQIRIVQRLVIKNKYLILNI